MINIVCATDDNFVQHCCIMLVSLLENNKDISIFILTEGLTPANVTIIRSEVERFGASVHFCKVDSSIIEKFPLPNSKSLKHISRATYYRLLIAELLPTSLDKVIYLDCDMIIDSSIKELWDIKLENYAMGACIQIGYGFEAKRLGYPIKYGYFNAGMNLINLRYFRENNVSQALIKYITDNFSKIKYHDQDALNGVLFDKTLHVKPQWNMTTYLYEPELEKRGDRINGNLVNSYKEEKENAKSHLETPSILHYVSSPKPWQRGCVHPLYHLYFKYASHTINFKMIKPEPMFLRFPYLFTHIIRQRLSIIKQFFIRTDSTRY